MVEIPEISNSDCELVYRLLSKKNYYFQYDYVLLANMIPYFSEQQVSVLVTNAFPIRDEEKRDERTKNSALNALLNLIHVRIYEGEWSLVKKYLKLAKKQDCFLKSYKHRLDLYYFDSLFTYLLTKDPKALEKTQLFIKVTEDIDEQHKADAMKNELHLLIQKQNEKSVETETIRRPVNLIKEG